MDPNDIFENKIRQIEKDIAMHLLARNVAKASQGSSGFDATKYYADPSNPELRGTGPGESRDPFRAAGYYDTPEYMSAKGAAEPAAALAYGEGHQIGNALDATRHAYDDPSLGNIANAGVQAAMTVPTYGAAKLAGGIAAGGMGIAAARDLPSWAASAEARPQAKPQEQHDGGIPYPPGLTADERASYGTAYQKLSNGDFSSGSERRELQGVLDNIRTVATARSNDQRISAQKAYDDKTEYAKTVRGDILKRDYRFDDSELGKYIKNMGGASGMGVVMAPFAGAIARAAMGPAKGWNALAPVLAGAGTEAAMDILPDWSNMVNAPSSNPEKEAYAAYARELPDGHPDKERARSYAEGLPTDNPVKTGAINALSTNPVMRFGAPAALGGLEGMLGAEMYGAAARAPGAAVRRLTAIPGQAEAGYYDGRAAANEAFNAVPTRGVMGGSTQGQPGVGAPAAGGPPDPGIGSLGNGPDYAPPAHGQFGGGQGVAQTSSDLTQPTFPK